ncbi:MAG TPA: YncE family protein [Candidatus Dormibacteraeota bacterium]|nr:YncE family protein [Candidatus Dormibacteraeota bacterium]
MKYVLASLVLLASVFGTIVQAEDTPTNALLILAKQDGMLLIVDPASLHVISHIPVGKDPHEVIASTDGKTAYASNYGSGAFNTLAVVDLVAQKSLPSIDLGALRGPHGLTFAGGKVWFTAEGSKAIGSYDPATKSVDWILGTGQNRTHMIYVSPDMKWIATTNVSSGTVNMIEKGMSGPGQGGPPAGAGAPRGPGSPMGPPRPDWNETVVRVGNGSEGFDVSADGKEIWVANAQDGTVSIIDVASKQVRETLAADVGGANRLKFTLDGKLAIISSLRSADVTVIDTASHKTIKKVAVGHGAAGILMEPGGARAFVACSPDGYVAVIDLHSLEVAGRIEAGHDPDGLAWATRH